MTMEWLWMLNNESERPYTYLKAVRVHGHYEIPQPMFKYLMEVCGVGAQTDRVYLLDAIEWLVRRKKAPSSETLIRMLVKSLEGDHALGEFERGLARTAREQAEAVESFFKTSDHDPEIWNLKDDVVYVKNPSVWPLRGVPRKNLSMISQKHTGASISVIRHQPDWIYIGAGHKRKVDLMAMLREIPDLDEGEGMVGHPYVVSMKDFSIAGCTEPVDFVVEYLRKTLNASN
jgi:hypothetical protein